MACGACRWCRSPRADDGSDTAVKEEFFQSVVEVVTELGAGIFEEVGISESQRTLGEGEIVYSSFVVWQGEGAERKGRFVINFSHQSKHWLK